MFINPIERSSGTKGLAHWPTSISHPKIRNRHSAGCIVCPKIIARWISDLRSGASKAVVMNPSTQRTHDVHTGAWGELTDALIWLALERGVFPDVCDHPSASAFDRSCSGMALMCRDGEVPRLAQLPPYEKRELLSYAKSIVADIPNIIVRDFDERMREQFPGVPRWRRRELWTEVSSRQQKRPGRRPSASKPLRPRKRNRSAK